MTRQISRLLLLCLLAYLLIPLAGCQSKERKAAPSAEAVPETTPVTETSTSMGTDLGTGSSMGSDMGTGSSMGSDMTELPPPDGEHYPEFPWPPPQASATAVIPRQFLANSKGSTTLQDVNRRLTEALERNGYFESSYYAVPQGFALVTKMEQIKADGQSSDKTVR